VRLQIGRVLKRAYDREPPVDRLMVDLARVASALNAGDHSDATFGAWLVASHLRFVDDKAHERPLRSTAKWRSIVSRRNEDAAQAANFVIASAHRSDPMSAGQLYRCAIAAPRK
jgi:hypothetical protein